VVLVEAEVVLQQPLVELHKVEVPILVVVVVARLDQAIQLTQALALLLLQEVVAQELL
jgi:uncharacterized protein YegL